MKANLQLFLDKFISVNQQKYADQPEVLALLDGLTLDDITFTRLDKDSSLGAGGRIADFESASRKFNAIDQQWICAELGSDTIITTIDDTVHASVDDIKAIGEAGLYRLSAGEIDTIVVVVESAELTAAEIKAQVAGMLVTDAGYTLTTEDFVWPETDPVVGTDFEASVDTDTIESSFNVVWLPEPNTGGGGTDPEEPGTGGEGGETDPGTGGETGGGEGGGSTDPEEPTDPEDELPQPPAQTPEEEALNDVTGGGTYAAPGEPGFGILTDERTVTTESATITTATPVASFAMPYFTAPSA